MRPSDAVTNVFLDTEFIDTGRLIQPISIALIAETGAEKVRRFRRHRSPQLSTQAMWFRAQAGREAPLPRWKEHKIAMPGGAGPIR